MSQAINAIVRVSLTWPETSCLVLLVSFITQARSVVRVGLQVTV
jgi:hypothetical protein